MLTNAPRTWVVGTAIGAVLLVIASWFLLIAPARESVVERRAEVSKAVTDNGALSAQVMAMRTSYVTLPGRQARMAELRSHLPATLGLASLTRELNQQARAAGVTLLSLAPGTPSDADATSTTTAAGQTSSSSSLSSTSSATSASTTSGSTAAGGAPSAPAISSGIVSTPVVLEIVGSLANTEVFLGDLSSMERDLLITGMSATSQSAAKASGATPATRTGDLKTEITAAVFVLPTTTAS